MKKTPLNAAPTEDGYGNENAGPVEERDGRKAVEESYLRQLEEENRRLKLAVADLTLRNQALKLVVGKKW